LKKFIRILKIWQRVKGNVSSINQKTFLKRNKGMIKRKSRHEISLMKAAGSIVAEVHNEMKSAVKAGVTTFELDEIAYNIIIKNKAIPTFKGYKGFPGTICASVNEEVVHGIPSRKRKLKKGDIISIDFGVLFKNYFGDSAITVPVGTVSDEVAKLVCVTEKALYSGIRKQDPCGGCYL